MSKDTFTITFTEEQHSLLIQAVMELRWRLEEDGFDYSDVNAANELRKLVSIAQPNKGK